MSYQFPCVVKQIFSEDKTERLTFMAQDHKFWWNYYDSKRTHLDEYQRCSEDYFPTLTDAEIDAFDRFGF